MNKRSKTIKKDKCIKCSIKDYNLIHIHIINPKSNKSKSRIGKSKTICSECFFKLTRNEITELNS